jgi:hypothetical protein
MIERERRTLTTVERLLSTAYARARISEAVYDVVTDGMSFGPCDLPRADDREWLRGALAMPIQEASDAALRSLAWEVTQALEHAPNGLLDRLEHSHRWQELGWE